MIPEARLTHAIPGRFRFKVPAMRRDTGYFATLAKEMPKAPGVISVRVNAVACSLLLHCDPEVAPESLAQYAAERQLFVLEPMHSALLSFLARMFAALQVILQKLRDPSGERYDKRAVLLLLLVTLAIRQTLRGEIMVPAFTLWLNAYLLMEQMGSTSKDTVDE